MIKKISIVFVIIALSSSCVSKKVFNELETKFADLKKENRKTQDLYDSISKSKSKLDADYSTLKKDYEKTKAERDKLAIDFAAADKNLKTLQASYTALEKNSDESLKENMTKNRELLAQLEAKEKALAAEKERLNKLSADLKKGTDRVNELESIMAAKEAAMKKLKDALTKSLKAFEGKGLTVNQRDGKVYVSMENKLLFEPIESPYAKRIKGVLSMYEKITKAVQERLETMNDIYEQVKFLLDEPFVLNLIHELHPCHQLLNYP